MASNDEDTKQFATRGKNAWLKSKASKKHRKVGHKSNSAEPTGRNHICFKNAKRSAGR